MTLQSAYTGDKVLDLALRLLLVDLHSEWGDAVYEPLPEALARWAPLFSGDYTDPHSGDCTKQCHTCMRCIRDDFVSRAQKRIAEDSA